MSVTVRKKRDRLREQFGDACKRCGYNKSSRALHFHHLDPAEKYVWSKGKHRVSLREVELHPERFELICANCHAELHDEMQESSKLYNYCKVCGKKIRTQANRRKNNREQFCSRECQHIHRARIAETPDAIEKRIMKHVTKTETCWIWNGNMMYEKTPVTLIKDGNRFRSKSVPRFMYEHHIAPLQRSRQVRRTCKNPRCINPLHLMST